jgi:tRNA G18 (ribose-2'-O)-methylase SpoU
VPGTQAKALRVSTRNASFQQWQALLTNRTKRHRAGRFVVQGVRPITLALHHHWPIDALLYRAGSRSDWASGILREFPTLARYELAPDLMSELGEKDEQPPELLAVAVILPDDTDRVPVPPDALLVVADRPGSPGNLGTLLRSADALGAHGLIVTGHAADLYDPRTVRATTGSLFAVPAVRAPGPDAVAEWVGVVRSRGVPLRVVGTAEDADADLAELDLTGPTLLVVGNETRGMSAGWESLSDVRARIPMVGSASSLNAAVSGSIALYEARRQRLAGARR